MITHDEKQDCVQEAETKRGRLRPLKHKTVLRVVKRALFDIVSKSKNEYVVLTASKLLLAYKDPMRGVRAIMKRGNILSEELDARQNEASEHAARITEIQSLLAELTESRFRGVVEPPALAEDSAARPVDTAG